MSRSPSRHPTELELEILKVLWRDGPLSVRQVRDALAPTRDLAYTSVMTVLGILAGKGYVTRTMRDGRHVYRPKVAERAVSRRMLGDLVDRVFDGSAAAVLVNLIETSDLDPEEIRRIREIIDRKVKEGRKAKEEKP